MFTSFSSLRTPKQTKETKRKWESNENVFEEEEDCIVTDILQTPPRKRVRKEKLQLDNRSPFIKVSSWIKETAKKTARVVRSFADRFIFWQDVEDDENTNDVYLPNSQRPDMNHRVYGQDSDFLAREQDEATSSNLTRKSFENNLTRPSLHEPGIPVPRRKVYDPSKYESVQRRDTARKDFWPPSLSRHVRREGAGHQSVIKKTTIDVRKTKTHGTEKSQDVKPLINSAVVRLQEREQYRQLIAHYRSSVGHESGECTTSGTQFVVEEAENHETNKKTNSTFRNTRHDQSLLSPELYPKRLSRTTAEEIPPVVKIQVSPSPTSSRAVDISRTVSVDVTKGVLETGSSNRRSTSMVASGLLGDDWIKKWKEAISSENLEKERKITKEKLRLETIRKKNDDFELISEEIKTRMKEKSASPVIEEKVDSFRELSAEMNSMVDKAFARGAPNENLVETPTGRITRADIATLGQQNWLNDEIVNIYFNMIAERSKKNGPKVHSFNTFFYSKLVKTGHASLRRWTKKVDLFSMDMILVPVHLGMHWCLAVIDFKTKIISYYDSLKGENSTCLQALRDYLCAESLDKKKKTLDLTGWKCDSPQNIPEQLNGCDCGVFICKYAEYISQRRTLDFTQYNMPYFRRRMVYEILSQKLL